MGKTRIKANDSVRFVPKILITMLPDFHKVPLILDYLT